VSPKARIRTRRPANGVAGAAPGGSRGKETGVGGQEERLDRGRHGPRPPLLGLPDGEHDGGRRVVRLDQVEDLVHQTEGRVDEVVVSAPPLPKRVDRLGARAQPQGVEPGDLSVGVGREPIHNVGAPPRVEVGKNGRRQAPVRPVRNAAEVFGPEIGGGAQPAPPQTKAAAHQHPTEAAAGLMERSRAGRHVGDHVLGHLVVDPQVEYPAAGVPQMAEAHQREGDGLNFLDVDLHPLHAEEEETASQDQVLVVPPPAIGGRVRRQGAEVGRPEGAPDLPAPPQPPPPR